MKRKAKTNKYLELNKLDYDDNSQDVKLINDTPIICYYVYMCRGAILGIVASVN